MDAPDERGKSFRQEYLGEWPKEEDLFFYDAWLEYHILMARVLPERRREVQRVMFDLRHANPAGYQSYKEYMTSLSDEGRVQEYYHRGEPHHLRDRLGWNRPQPKKNRIIMSSKKEI